MNAYTHTHHHDDDEDAAFDVRGVLRDGEALRVPFHMMDSLSRSVSRGYSGAGNRPGYRLADDVGLSAKRRKQQVYQQYDAEVSAAYKNVTDATGEFARGAQAGDTCTINGNRGRLRRDASGRLVCVPDQRNDAARGCPDCDGTGRCDRCDGEGSIEEDDNGNGYERDPDEIVRNTQTFNGSSDSRRVASDHRTKMAGVYSSYDAELSSAWRK
jgi:hypothetical protein